MMTARQKQLFDFLNREIAKSGRSPSYREIVAHFGWRSITTVHRLVDGLEDRGFIERFGRRQKMQLRIVRHPTVAEIAASAPRRQSYTSFRFDDNLKTLVEHRKYTSAA